MEKLVKETSHNSYPHKLNFINLVYAECWPINCFRWQKDHEIN